MKDTIFRHAAAGAGGSRGFTLVELMVAVTLSGIMTVAALGVFLQQRMALKSNQIINETQQNTRTAIDMIARDMRMAGYGLKVSAADLPLWIDWAEDLSGNPFTMDANPKIVDDGAGGPDSVWIAGAFEAPVTTLANPGPQGSVMITLNSGGGAEFNTTDKKVIFIGKCETARITAVAGDVLTVSTHPTSARGLQFDHPAGSLVELVKVRSYEVNTQVNNYPFRPYLTRDDSIANSFQFYWQRMIAAGIEDLQLTRTDNRVDIEITGVASVGDQNFFGGQNGDKTRRLVLASSAYLRNKP